MAFRVEQTREILGPRLAQLWFSSRTRFRPVTCVTCLEDLDEGLDFQAGELTVLAAGPSAEQCALEVMERSAASTLVAMIIPSSAVSDRAQRRLREMATTGDVAVGLLAPEVDARAAANRLSRALASMHGEPELARLHTAETLQGVADTLGRLVGNSVTIETPAHEVLASSPTGSDVDQDRVDTILRRHAAAKIMEQPDFKQFFARVRTSDWPLHLEAHPEYGHSGRIAMRIAADGELFGAIWVTDTARPLTENDYATIRQAAEVSAAIFARQQMATRREAMLRAELLDDVIRGRIIDPENVRTVALSVGWNIDRLQQALVVSIDEFESFRLRHAGRTGAALRRAQERLVELVKLEVLAVDPEAVVGMRSSSVVILLDSGQEQDADRKAAALRLAESIVRLCAAFLQDTRVTVGVGRDFPTLEHMAESFRQAELAAELGQTLWGGNRSVHYDDLGIHRVLFSLREHEGMMTPGLQRIMTHDEEHGTDYVRTLAAYLRNMGRLRPAAVELGVHRNTLEYRVGRIAQLAGVDLENADNRLALELGIRLLELNGSPMRGTNIGTKNAD
jgi:sugar diacid utilization regulator